MGETSCLIWKQSVCLDQIVDIIFPFRDKSSFFFQDFVKEATLFHKHLYISESRNVNLKTKCLYICWIVSLWTTLLAFCGILSKRENKTRLAVSLGREMNESLLMSLCCRDNVNLIIQRAGTSAFAFLTSHDVGAFLCFSCYWMSLAKRHI